MEQICLRGLARPSLISRKPFSEVLPRAENSFTGMGRDLLPVFCEMICREAKIS
ncbi:MAG: hypothetical protein HDQ87_06870 [Clostridia bacterium]|nr:hypothetical protein [Clostridia bacterium]